MTDTTPVRCGKYCCSKVRTLKDKPITSMPDLKNSIHPIFDRSKFSEDVDYDAMKMSLRLASRILESDAAAMFITTMIDGDTYLQTDGKPGKLTHPREVEDIMEAEGHCRVRMFPDEAYRKPNHATRRRAKVLFKQAARRLTSYKIDTTLKPGVRGMFARDESAPPTSPTSTHNFPGSHQINGFTIKINAKTYAELRSIVRWSLHKNSPYSKEQLFLIQMDMAMILIHEIGHLIGEVYMGFYPEECEIFYRDSEVSEHGFDFVNQIFGGGELGSYKVPVSNCRNASTGPSVVVQVTEWPSGETFNRYRDLDFWISSTWTPEEIPRGGTVWRVPTSFIEKLFREQFWTEEVLGKGVDALKAPRVGAYVYPTNWDDVAIYDGEGMEGLTAEQQEIIAAQRRKFADSGVVKKRAGTS